MHRTTCSQRYVTPILLLFQGSELSYYFELFLPGMQTKIVQELVVAVHDMFLYIWKNVFSEVGLDDQDDKIMSKGHCSNFPNPCATDRER